jgi:hypothetical protein
MSEVGEKGVCRLSVVPVRQLPADTSEMVSQLLFGDHYSIVEIDTSANWLKIRIHFDQYEGWIDLKQHHTISNEYFDQINSSDFKISLDVSASLLYKKKHINILLGSILPMSNSELFKIEEQLAFNGDAKSLGQRREFEFIVGVIKKYRYAPYLWGGKTPFGIDCSGFVQMVYKIGGYRLKRDAKDQALQGVKVNEISEAQAGDLFFFGDAEKITHVGIYMGLNKIYHASGRVREDDLTLEGIINLETQLLTHQFQTIRRVIK